MRVLDKVLDNIKKYNLVEEGDKVLVGVSGGVDSICLLHVLFSLREILKIKLFAVHINHMLRGKEADDDENYVKSMCSSLGIEFKSVFADVSSIARVEKVSTEEAGRTVRYKEFEQLSNDFGVTKIAVAHNMNDQAETVIMHILRGSGLDGLKGMDFKRGKIIRPLLNIERNEIEEYCVINDLKPRTDSSNMTDIYTRNKVRLKLLPYINDLFDTDIISGICKMSNLIRDDSEFLKNITKDAYLKCLKKKSDSVIYLDIPKLIKYHISICKRIIRYAINELNGDIKDIQNIHVESIINLALDGKTGSTVQIPKNMRASKVYNELKLFIDEDDDSVKEFEQIINISGINSIDILKSSLNASVIDYTFDFKKHDKMAYYDLIQFFDYDTLNDGIYIRNRRNGDVFKPLKSNGTKKLKEYFIDKKIPRDKRESIPLIALGEQIVWVIGYKISDNYKVTEKTKKILKLEYTMSTNK